MLGGGHNANGNN